MPKTASMPKTSAPRRFFTRTLILAAVLAASTAARPAGALPCDATVTATHGGLAGTTAPMAADGSTATAFQSSYDNWQYLQLRFDCEIELTALRRFMSRASPILQTYGHRGLQGEQASYSLDGQTFTYLKPTTTTGWESYVAYHPQAWHSVAYGWSAWLTPQQPVRARWVRFHWDGNNDRLNEVELDARPVLDVTDLRLTQSGMVTTPLPPLPLVAGKTTLLRATVASIPGGPGAADEAFVDVLREDTGALTGTVRGYAIAADNQSLRSSIANGDHVHFFVPRQRLAAEAPYRFKVRLVSGGQSHARTVLSGVTTQENRGIPALFIDYNEGLFESLSDLLRYIDAIIHTTRILPIKDTNGGLLPYGSSTAGAHGLRYEYTMNLPLAQPGSLGNFTRDFVLDDLVQGTGNNAAGQNCAADIPRTFTTGRVFAYNFTYPEDLDGDGNFSPAELAQCMPGPSGDPPLLDRINNFGNKIWSDLRQGKAQTMASGWEFPPYALQLVPYGPTRHLRGGWLGYAGGDVGWSAVAMAPSNPYPALPHELAHQLGRNHRNPTLPGPAYDLKQKRRVPSPFDVMATLFPGSQTFHNSFLNDTDWNALRAVIPPATGSVEPPAAGPPTVRVTGVMTADGTVRILGTRTLPSPVESVTLKEDLRLALLDEGGEELATGPAEVESGTVADWPEELPEPTDLRWRGEVAWKDEASALAVLAESGEELARIPVSRTAPSVSILSVETEGDPLAVEWKGQDDDDEDVLVYDVVFVYPDGREIAAGVGTAETRLEVPAGRIPGGEGVTVRVRASDGFRTAEDELPDLALADRPPQVFILAPATGESFEAGSWVAFAATAPDPEDGPLGGESLVWTSDRDGDLGSGEELVAELSSGTHQVTVEATDSAGGKATASVEITVD